MAEQQLVDYIKKAREAKQSDDQSKTLLIKNGWTDAEIGDALLSLNQPQPQPQPQIQPQIQPQVVAQTKVEAQPQIISQPQTQPQPIINYQPQVQFKPEYLPDSMQNNMPQTKPSLHLVLKFIIVLIIIAVLGVVGYFTVGRYLNLPYSNLFWSSFTPDPQTVIAKMVTNMENVKYSHTVMQANITTSQLGVMLNTNTEIDTTNNNNPKGDGNLTINLTTPGSATPTSSASISAVFINNALYLKVNSVTPPNVVFYPGLDLGFIGAAKGKWLKVDETSIKSYSQQTISSDVIKKIQTVFASENIFSNVKQLSDENVGGQDTYHYSATITKDKLKNLISQITLPALSINADAIGDTNIEMWVGQKDYMLYQVKFDKIINPQLEIKLSMVNSNFNKPITVQEPTGAQKIESFISPANNALPQLQRMQTDITTIGSTAQLSFGVNKSYSSLCTTGLLNGYLKTYGSTLIKLNNDLISLGAKKPVCFSADQSFCVSTQLTDESYLCIDKNNVVGKTKCVSAQTVCK